MLAVVVVVAVLLYQEAIAVRICRDRPERSIVIVAVLSVGHAISVFICAGVGLPGIGIGIGIGVRVGIGIGIGIGIEIDEGRGCFSGLLTAAEPDKGQQN